MKMLEFSTMSDTKYEIHMMKPKEFFPGFGGSSRGLVIGKTASIIVREMSVWGCKDTEHDIDDPWLWGWIGKLMDSKLVTVVSNEEVE
jgi:hypothetical protein